MNTFDFLRVEDLGDNERMRRLLLLALSIAAGVSAVYYWLPEPDYDRSVNLYLSGVLLALLPLAWFNVNRRWIAHLFMACVMGSMTYIATATGGVHSSVMVWMVVSFVAALMFLGPNATLFWVAVSLLLQLSLWWAVNAGWVGADIDTGTGALPWALLNQAGALACLMLGLWLFDRMHEKRLSEVKQRNDELMRVHVSLQNAQAHKDEFIAAIGHELRTPMNAILGLNGVLRDEYADQPDVAETVDHIRHSTQRLLGLVNDILNYSQLQAGKVSFTPESCYVPSWFEPLQTKYQSLADDKKIELVVDLSPIAVRIDAFRLKQVVEQLLDNAFKFTDKGHIQIKVFYQSFFLRVEVQDTGRGIPEHRQLDVFKRFEHADQQTNRAYGGTGLGLAICERLVSLQRGRIGVTSREGEGSLFWFEIPCELLEGDAQTPSLQKLRQLPTHLRMLVVDDNPVNLMVAKVQLGKLFPMAAVDVARSGQEALDMLQDKHYHAALVDMVMPDMDGLELTQKLRKMEPPIAHMPIVALTANQNPVDIQRCLDVGMNAVLHKPMDEVVLKSTLTQWLAEPQAGDAA